MHVEPLKSQLLHLHLTVAVISSPKGVWSTWKNVYC